MLLGAIRQSGKIMLEAESHLRESHRRGRVDGLDVIDACDSWGLTSDGPHQHNYLGFNCFNLSSQVWYASFNLVWKRFAIVRRNMLNYVCNKEYLAVDTVLGEDLVEEFSRPTDERLAYLVFFLTWILPNQHHLSAEWAFSRDGLLRALPESTFFALAYSFIKFGNVHECRLWVCIDSHKDLRKSKAIYWISLFLSVEGFVQEEFV